MESLQKEVEIDREKRFRRKTKMNIGIDIDNEISNFNEALKEEFLKHDK